MRLQPSPIADALWSSVRETKKKGITAPEAATSTSCEPSYARVRLRRWMEAGYLRSHLDESSGVARYVIAPGAPKSAPMVTTGGEVIDKTPAMTPKAFAAIRRKLGISAAEMGRRLGWAGQPNSIIRSVRRFEQGERSIDASLAAKARALIDDGAGTARVQLAD